MSLAEGLLVLCPGTWFRGTAQPARPGVEPGLPVRYSFSSGAIASVLPADCVPDLPRGSNIMNLKNSGQYPLPVLPGSVLASSLAGCST